MQRYDAFISYSHSGDGALAPRLQSGIERFACPWWKRRVLRVFRDETGLTASPHLWPSIVEAMDASEWFILLASPEAAASEWVGREVDHWLTHRDGTRMLIVVTDGTFDWDDDAGDIDWSRTSAAPPVLRGRLESEPRHVDLTWARSEVSIDRRDGRFQDTLADLAAPLRGVAKDEIAGADVRQHRRTMSLAKGAAVALAVLTVMSVVAGGIAFAQRDEADRQRSDAEVQRMTAVLERQNAEQQRAEAETQRAEAEEQRAAAEKQRAAAEEERERADAQALEATVRSASANAALAADIDYQRALLLGAAAVDLDQSDDAAPGLLSALSAASGLRASHPEVGDVGALAITPAGDRLATVTREGLVRVWSYPDVELLRESPQADGRAPLGLQFVDDARVVVLYAEAGLIRLDASTLEPIGELLRPETGPDSSAIVGDVSDDGSIVAMAAFGALAVEVRDLATGASRLVPVDGECFGISGVDIHMATGRLAVACDTFVGVYDLASGAVVQTAGESFATGLGYSPDGRLLAITHVTSGVRILDSTTLESLTDIPTAGRAYVANFSGDGGFVVLGTDRGKVEVHVLLPPPDAPDEFMVGDARRVFSFGGIEGGVLGTAFVPSRDALQFEVPAVLAGGPSGLSEWDPEVVPNFAVDSVQLVEADFVVQDPQRREVYLPTSLGEPGDTSRTLKVVGYDGNVRRSIEFTGPPGFVDVLDFAVEDQLIVTPGAMEWPERSPSDPVLIAPNRVMVQVIDGRTGDVTAQVDAVELGPVEVPQGAIELAASQPGFFGPDGHYVGTLAARLSPDGRRLFVAVDELSGVWDLATGALLATSTQIFAALPSIAVSAGSPTLSSAAWTSEGDELLVGTRNGHLRLYSGEDLSLLRELELRGGYSVSDIRPVEGASQMVVTVESGEVYLIDVPSLEVDGDPFTASVQLQSGVVDVDADLVAAIDRSGELRLWRLSTRLPLGPPLRVAEGNQNYSVVELGFVDDGVWIEVRQSGVVIVPTDLAVLARMACDFAGRQLTAKEWELYVGDLPQQQC